MPHNRRKSWIWAAALLLLACGEDATREGEADPDPAAEEEQPPAEPPEGTFAPLPDAQDVSERVRLGRSLFFDTRLSADDTISCATCHQLDHGGAEPRRVPTGVRGQQGAVNTPTVLNAGARGDLDEMLAEHAADSRGMSTPWDELPERLAEDEELSASFEEVYGDGVTADHVTSALAAYVESLVTPAPFDRFLRGDESALTDAQQAGYRRFHALGCTGCHAGATLGGDDPEAPALRNVELTAPYFRDGSVDTLEEAVQPTGHHDRELTDAQVAHIVAFLRALTGELPEHALPPVDEAEEEDDEVAGDSEAPEPEQEGASTGG